MTVLAADPSAVTDTGSDTTIDSPAVAAPGVPVAVKVTDTPSLRVAVRVFVPTTWPSCQEVLARPFAFVVTDCVPIDPPPDAIAKVTVAPARGNPSVALTNTVGALLTSWSTTCDWLLPDATSTVEEVVGDVNA